jgi:Stress responsive A/B Barrel Domain
MMSIRRNLLAFAAAGLLVGGLPQPAWANVFHVVTFRFKSDVTALQRQSFARQIQALSETSKWDGRPLIVSIRYGEPMSREGFDQGFQQMFIVEFRNAADRDYFVGPPYRDAAEAAHQRVIDQVLPHVERGPGGEITGTFVYDFETEVFSTPTPNSHTK